MDLYSVLGLPRGASVAEVKRAYRRLSRRYHPGINPGDRAAAALFQRITEAYETLVDPERRRRYEEAGVSQPTGDGHTFEFSGFDFSIAAHGAQAATFSELFAEALHPPAAPDGGRPQPGADLHTGLSLGFVEALHGGERQVTVTRHVRCEACAGAGRIRVAEGRCAHCQGSGRVRWARGHMVFTKGCTACGSTGRERFRRCAVCAGHGRSVRTEGIVVRIPAGIADGAQLRIPERGHAGTHGGRPGDLYVDITVRPHPVLRREGDDLHLAVPVAVHEAVLGARIELPSFDGPVRLKIPAGTQAGQRLRVSGRGAVTLDGRRGDLYVEVRLALPPVVDERSKELMREFGRLNDEDVRRTLVQQMKAAE
ncbi:MAG TPA: J domain-containing protein [Vicinamibacterales bacterium]|nr:J domain-containing protein [Vicinamibacterales bacterium]